MFALRTVSAPCISLSQIVSVIILESKTREKQWVVRLKYAQLSLRQLTLNQRVQGSSPCAPTNLFNRLGGFCSQNFRHCRKLGAYWEQAGESLFAIGVACLHHAAQSVVFVQLVDFALKLRFFTLIGSNGCEQRSCNLCGGLAAFGREVRSDALGSLLATKASAAPSARRPLIRWGFSK